MSALLTSKQVCERALRMIGAYPLADSAARPEELNEALFWLDLQVAHLSGATRCFWLVPATISISLTGGTQSYALPTVLGANYPGDDIQFPIKAMLDDGSNREPLEIVTREKFEAFGDPDESGDPKYIWIDRLVPSTSSPTLKTFPILGTGVTGYSIKLVVQTFGEQIAPVGVTAGAGIGNYAHGLKASWQLWCVNELAANIGSGAVRALASTRVTEYRKEAARKLLELTAFENRQHETTPPFTKASLYA